MPSLCNAEEHLRETETASLPLKDSEFRQDKNVQRGEQQYDMAAITVTIFTVCTGNPEEGNTKGVIVDE